MSSLGRSRHRVAVTRRLPPAVEEHLAGEYDAVLNGDDRQLHPQDLVDLARGADAVVVTPTEAVTEDVLRQFGGNLGIVATYSVGFDHIDLAAAARAGITVTNTPDVLTEATADVAMLCLLGAARRVREAQSMLYGGNWSRWSPTELLGRELSGARLGIIGMGRIGQAFARRAAGFGLEIAYWNRRPVERADAAGFRYLSDLDDLFRRSDIVSLHLPATAETRHLLDGRRIALLPPDAIVVNTARGALIDDDAVITALQAGKIAAAGLDVFDGEPDLHPGYLELPNVFLLPHIGSATVQARNAMGFRVLRNLAAHFSGTDVPDRIVSPA